MAAAPAQTKINQPPEETEKKGDTVYCLVMLAGNVFEQNELTPRKGACPIHTKNGCLTEETGDLCVCMYEPAPCDHPTCRDGKRTGGGAGCFAVALSPRMLHTARDTIIWGTGTVCRSSVFCTVMHVRSHSHLPAQRRRERKKAEMHACKFRDGTKKNTT